MSEKLATSERLARAQAEAWLNSPEGRSARAEFGIPNPLDRKGRGKKRA